MEHFFSFGERETLLRSTIVMVTIVSFSGLNQIKKKKKKFFLNEWTAGFWSDSVFVVSPGQ